MSEKRELYPEIEAYEKGFLPVSVEHQVYYEISGNPEGFPIITLHGGPGSGSDPKMRRLYDPEKFKIILMDQRGCGKSQKTGELKNNNTQELCKDIEKLRKRLQIEKWIVAGPSWGSTLALYYAIQHPERVQKLFLRGIFLGRKKDNDWFYQFQSDKVNPSAWKSFISILSEEEQKDVLEAYVKRIFSSDTEISAEAKKHWADWEFALYTAPWSKEELADETAHEVTPEVRAYLDNHAILEAHYFSNNCFFPEDDWIMKNIAPIKDIPTVIVHGTQDQITPIESAHTLRKALNNCKFVEVPEGCHSGKRLHMQNAMLRESELLLDFL